MQPIAELQLNLSAGHSRANYSDNDCRDRRVPHGSDATDGRAGPVQSCWPMGVSSGSRKGTFSKSQLQDLPAHHAPPDDVDCESKSSYVTQKASKGVPKFPMAMKTDSEKNVSFEAEVPKVTGANC